MKEEIAKVLEMVQKGKIDAEKAAELIQIMKEKEELQVVSAKPAKYLDKTLKIRVNSKENDNVIVNLPIKLVKAVLAAGLSIAANVPQTEKYVKDIDIDMLIQAIENEIDGQIVDVKTGEGDTVAVFVE